MPPTVFAKALVVPFMTLVVGVPAIAACSSNSASAGCTQRGVCPNDPAPMTTQIDACNGKVTDPRCGAKYQALRNCIATNEKCDSAGNEDPVATQQACSSQQSDYSSCLPGQDGG
jgi:hypothetical protein